MKYTRLLHGFPAAVTPDILPCARPPTAMQAFGGWQQAQARHFSDDGIFDQIYSKR